MHIYIAYHRTCKESSVRLFVYQKLSPVNWERAMLHIRLSSLTATWTSTKNSEATSKLRWTSCNDSALGWRHRLRLLEFFAQCMAVIVGDIYMHNSLVLFWLIQLCHVNLSLRYSSLVSVSSDFETFGERESIVIK